MHADRDEQSTLFRKGNCDPEGLGVGSMRHLVPFHRSANVPALDPPTAVHDDDALQATPDRKPPPCGLGVGSIRQLRPFHRSASVPPFEAPTAVQVEGAMHDTSLRRAPAGLGACWRRHLDPFHRSTMILELGVNGFEAPTARHADRSGHATPNRTLCREPAGLGVGSIRQRWPFHRSTKVVALPEAATVFPTAMHAEGALHATPLSTLTLAPAGFGVGWTRHREPFHRSAKVTATFEAFWYMPTAVHDVLLQVPNSS
ncbi:MAG: hypothetical protein ACTHQQ_02420 [Solirubrobacteraceae bacterium]